MFQRFDEQSKKILKNAKLEMQNLKHSFVGSEHLILSILSFKNLNITLKLKEYNINYTKFKQELINTIGIGNSLNNYFIYTPMLKRIIENASLCAKEENIIEITPNLLFLSLLEEGEGVGIRILNNLGLNIDKLYQELENSKPINFRYKIHKKLSIYEHAIDLNEKAGNGQIDPVIGREKEINRLIEILLRKNKNNPLLLGDAGVGKTAIVEGLALRIYNKEVPEQLIDKKILSVSMASLIAGTKYRGEFEERISKIIREIESDANLIIFIDEMHSIVGAGGAEGAIDASNILKPSLARGKLRLIGATTFKEYRDTIEKDKALNRRFQTVLVEEPSLEETKNILEKIKPVYEKYHNIIIPDSIILDIINLSDKYIFERKNPDKSIDILDEACAKRSLIKDKKTEKLESLKLSYQNTLKEKNNYIISHDFLNASKLKEQEMILQDKINNIKINDLKNSKKIVTKEDVISVIESKTKVPFYKLNKTNLKKIKLFETKLKNEIIGQDEAIKLLVQETKKINLGLKNNKKPVSFLFTGKSGIGKTYLALEYSKITNTKLIRIDGSEYLENHSMSKFIGSPPGYVGYGESTVLDEVKTNPYSIILIDEIEKASRPFINLFLQILDEGFITNSNLEKIYFNNTIIIMTSNATGDINTIGFNKTNNKAIKEKLENYFSIEFLNRINHVVQFNDLDYDMIKQIIIKEINNIKNKFSNYDIEIEIDKNIIDEIIKISDYKMSGARKIKKILEEKIDEMIIHSILNESKKIKINSI